jgi:biotin carboxyl carrier protein
MRALAAMGVLFAVLVLPDPAAAAGKSDVAALQVGLRLEHLYAGPVDGLLGPRTVEGIRELERRAGLAVTGRPGRRVRLAFGSFGLRQLGSRVLSPGAGGWDVARFQFLLAWQGFPSGPFNGRYTERTARAVRRFQRAKGMDVDGIAGAATQAAVRHHPPESPVRLRPPVESPLTGFFGPRDDRFHTGVDYAAATGTRVHAAAAGTVTYAGWHPGGWGFLVSIAHGGGVRSMSAHLSRVDVKVGQRVRAGETIGGVGSSGISSGPHLHFEARLRGAAFDPLPSLR